MREAVFAASEPKSSQRPEPTLYSNYGDSLMAAYEPYCDGALECWTTKHLENFVNVIAGASRVAD
jgi:hypothetical protein